MNWFLSLGLLLYTGITSRQSGGGFGAQYLPSKLTWVPEVFFAIPFGLPIALLLYPIIGWYAAIPAVLCFVWSYMWMQSATAPGLHWGRGGYNPNRTSTLKPFVDWLNTLTFRKWKIGPHYDPSTAAYCRLYMGVKGFLIGLPVGGLPLAILWPLGYEIGDRVRSHTVSETTAGIGAGVAILIPLLVLGLL